MKMTFQEYVQQQDEIAGAVARGVGGIVSGGVGAAMGLGAGMLDAVRGKGILSPLKRALRGGKNFAASTWSDGKYGDHDSQGNPRFMKKR